LCILGLEMILSSGVLVWFRFILVMLWKFSCRDLLVFFFRCACVSWIVLVFFFEYDLEVVVLYDCDQCARSGFHVECHGWI